VTYTVTKMLRRAARVEPQEHVEDVRLWLGVHDLSRIEWTAAGQLPPAASRRYDVGFAREIPAALFPTHRGGGHPQILPRLQSPAEEGPLAIERHDLEELRRDALGVAHRLKRLGQRFERSCVAAAAQLRELPDPGLAETLADLPLQAAQLMADL